MRKYTDSSGNVTGTSKEFQGGLCGCLTVLFVLLIVIGAIAGLAHS